MCSREVPQLKEVRENHFVACFFAGSAGIKSS
jgi:hypothetical protein